MTPLLLMYTLGHDFVPPRSTPAGCATTATPRSSRRWCGPAGWRRSPILRARFSSLWFEWARTQGTVPAPETYAIRAAIDEALKAKAEGAERVILFNYSGHGLLDLSAYDDFLHGRASDG